MGNMRGHDEQLPGFHGPRPAADGKRALALHDVHGSVVRGGVFAGLASVGGNGPMVDRLFLSFAQRD